MSKVLIIEDDEILNAGLCFHLQRKNIETEPAYTLAEADSYLKSQEPDLILLDVNLPDGSGFDFARKVLATSECDLLVLDEILGVVDAGVISVEELCAIIRAKTEETDVILTGRRLPEELREIADEVYNIIAEK